MERSERSSKPMIRASRRDSQASNNQSYHIDEFRQDIENRQLMSVANRLYSFPLSEDFLLHQQDHQQNSSYLQNNQSEQMLHYDLFSQNQKPEIDINIHFFKKQLNKPLKQKIQPEFSNHKAKLNQSLKLVRKCFFGYEKHTATTARISTQRTKINNS